MTADGFEVAAPSSFELTYQYVLPLWPIVYDGNVYFYTESARIDTGSFTTLYKGLIRLTPDGHASIASTFGKEKLPLPSVVIDFDTQTYQGIRTDDSADLIYVVENGETRILELPTGKFSLHGFLGGTFYASAIDLEGNLGLFALVEDDWINVLSLDGSRPITDLTRFVQMNVVSDAADVWLGDETSEHVNSGEKDSIVYGRAGDDVLRGGIGNDSLYGDEGNDRLNGGEGDDTISGGEGDDKVFGRQGDDDIDGGAGDDRLRGASGNDELDGGDGNDTVFGGEGDDIVRGGAGDDALMGNGGADQVFGEDGADTLFGQTGADQMLGGSNDDTLFGGNSGDTLIGGAGIDVMDGGTGFDVFEFNAISESAFGYADTISGFDGAGAGGGDTIDVAGIDANTNVVGDQAFTFLGAVTSAVGLSFGAGALWVQEFGGQTRLYGEVNGDGIIDTELRINDGPGTDATDFTAGDLFL